MKDNIIILILLAITSILGVYITNNNSNIFTKNNSTRDYNYEHYCDSIYEVNPDYYLDVLIETDEFQNYIDEHGEWWTD